MKSIPSLSDPCGEHFTYRDFIHCGETWHRLQREAPGSVPNLPKQPETYAAMREICELVLDPVIRAFEYPIELTYAFASQALAKNVKGRSSPSRDQHASYELNTKNKPVCARLGMAVDFRIRDISSGDVALYIAEGIVFDRLYYYGEDRPVHVSIGPERNGQIVQMLLSASGKLYPRVTPKRVFVESLGG